MLRGVPTSILRSDPTNRSGSMSSLRIRGLCASWGAVGPEKIENIPSLVHNMTPSPIGYGQYPSCQTQLEAHSKQAYASQSIQQHSAMHIEAFVNVWRCLGTFRGPYRVLANIHGQMHMTTYGVSPCIWTSGGPPGLKTHRKTSANTLPCILKHLAVFGDAWGLPEVHIWYDLT